MPNINREHFARRLLVLYDRLDDPDFNIANYSHVVMQAFLEFGSATPDNQAAYDLIEFGTAENSDNPYVVSFGFKLKDKAIFVTDLLNELESLPMPESIKEKYVDLTEDEWQALMRVATMINNAFFPFKPK